MFKKILVILTISMFLLGMATRAEAENAKEEAEKESKPVSTAIEGGKAFEANYQISAASISNIAQGDTITHVIFDEAEIAVSKAKAMGVEGLEQKDPNEKINVKYPKVVMISDKKTIEKHKAKLLKFFSNKGELIKEIHVQKYISEREGGPAEVVIAKGEKYLCVNAPLKANEKGIWKKKTVVLDSEGNRLWDFEHNLVAIYLSPNGEYLVGQGWEGGPVVVYDKNGKILNEMENNAFNDISFSDDGNYFAIILEGVDREMKTERYIDRAYADLVIVNAQGNELWRKARIAKGMASGAKVKISNDTIIVITGVSEYKFYYLDKNGKLLKTEQGDVKQLRNFKD